VRLYSGARLSPPPSLNALASVLLALNMIALCAAALVLWLFRRRDPSRDKTVESLARLEI
jgi:hypothetical protein